MSHHIHINITLLLTSLHIISLSHQPHISIKSLRNHFHTRCHITNMHYSVLTSSHITIATDRYFQFLSDPDPIIVFTEIDTFSHV